MEADAALVRADGVVMLHTITHIGAHPACIVDPRDAERIYAVGDTQAFEQVDALEVGILVVDVGDGRGHFLYGLKILRLVGKPAAEVFDKFFRIHFLRN